MVGKDIFKKTYIHNKTPNNNHIWNLFYGKFLNFFENFGFTTRYRHESVEKLPKMTSMSRPATKYLVTMIFGTQN